MTRRTKSPLTQVTIVLSTIFLANSSLAALPGAVGAVMDAPAHGLSGGHHATAVRPPHAAMARPRSCPSNARSVGALPAPLATFETPYVPGRCDPMHLLPKQAWQMFACVRWREGGDTADQPNGAGMYQFTNRATWDEFRGSFAEIPSEATPLQQDIVAYRAWKIEQFFPWNGDPCLGSVRQYGKWGWY